MSVRTLLRIAAPFGSIMALVGAFQSLLWHLDSGRHGHARSEGPNKTSPRRGCHALDAFLKPIGTVVGALIGAIREAAGRGLRAIGDRRRARNAAPTNYP